MVTKIELLTAWKRKEGGALKDWWYLYDDV